MIIDLKYHIASLIAVFLALGIGILIGSAVLGNNVNDAIVQQQKQIVENLQKDFNQIRQESQSAKEEIQGYKAAISNHKQFEKSVLPAVLNQKLTNKKIAVVETSNYGFHEDWINVLKSAGAEIISITTVLEGFDLKSEDTRRAVATKLLLDDISEEAVAKAIANEVAGGIVSGQNLENIDYLEQLGLLKYSGKFGEAVNSVIVIGGSQSEEKRSTVLDLPMMKYFLAHNIPVYGVEASDVAFSYMKDFQKLKISTVDNVDQISGQVSLVYAIFGKPGNYGIKPTARQLMPSLP